MEPVLALLSSPADIGILALVVLVLFGGSQVPKLARGLGQAKNEFEKGQKGSHEPVADGEARPESLERQLPETKPLESKPTDPDAKA